MIKILRYLKPYWLNLILLLAFTSIQVWATLQLPDFLSKIVNEGIVAQNQDIIISNGINMLLIALIGGVCTIIAGFLSSIIGMSYTRDLRTSLFSRIESFSLAEFNKFSTASLITRSTNDITQVQTVLVMMFRMVIAAPITATVAIIKAWNNAPSMSWIIITAVISVISIIGVVFTFAIPKFQLMQKLTDKLNLVVRESLTGIRVIRAFNNQHVEEKKIRQVNSDLRNTALFINRLMVILQPTMFLVMNLASIAIIWFGAQLIQTNDLQIGNMLAFMQYSLQVIIAFLMISIVFIMVPRAAVSANRIEEILDTEISVKDPEIKKESKENIGKIEFKDVKFSYSNADEAVLDNISFTSNPGKVTAIIGSTGSGKTTLINLIPRFYDVIDGEILLDNINIKDIPQEKLHEKIGFVSQKAIIFSGTIESNIKYGSPNASNEEMFHAADIAQATEFINILPDKFQTQVSQDGTNFSGGQKQRISIARAIVKNPLIYIFDDSFSALDFKTDATLRKDLYKETSDKNVIIVAQRINTIIEADQIIVLDKGKIVGKGTHKELMEICDVYKEIAYSQLSEKEISNSLA